MKSSHLSRNIRLLFMSATIAAVAAFGIFGASWATPARADGGSGTVPGSGGGGGSNSNNNSTNSNTSNNPDGFDSSAAAGVCGTGPQSFSLAAPNDVTKLLSIGIGTVKINSTTGGVGNGAVRILFAPITSFSAKLIAATALNSSPTGWTDLGCGVQTSGKVSDGRELTYVVKGQQVCFTLPVGAAAAYSSLRIAYWDALLTRWVFLTTKVTDTQACHSSFRLAPATFALFGSA